MAVRRGGRKADTAIAHNHSGDTMPGGRRHFIIPCCLAIIMGVDIDKSGGDDFSCCINGFARIAQIVAYRRNAIAINGNIGVFGRTARAVI